MKRFLRITIATFGLLGALGLGVGCAESEQGETSTKAYQDWHMRDVMVSQ